MSEKPIRFPVGYLTRKVIDVHKGDVVKDFGKVLSVKKIKNHIFTDNLFQIDYITDAIQLKSKSALTGRMLYEVLPIDADVEVLMYEFIE